MMWGAIGWVAPSELLEINGRITGEVYRAFIEENVYLVMNHLAINPVIFQQDNAPAHAAHANNHGVVRSSPNRSPSVAIQLSRLEPYGKRLGVASAQGLRQRSAAVQVHY